MQPWQKVIVNVVDLIPDIPVLYGDHHDLLLRGEDPGVVQVQGVGATVETTTVDPNLRMLMMKNKRRRSSSP